MVFLIVPSTNLSRDGPKNQACRIAMVSDFDPGTTVEAMRAANNDNVVKAQTINLLERAIVYSGNIPGTPEYWKATYHEFVAANFAQSYLFDKDINMFITCSLA